MEHVERAGYYMPDRGCDRVHVAVAEQGRGGAHGYARTMCNSAHSCAWYVPFSLLFSSCAIVCGCTQLP